MLRATLTSLFARKVRLLLSVLAIVVGVAFASGAQVVTETLTRANTTAARADYAAIDVRVTAGSPVPARLLATVGAVPGVSRVDGRVRADGARVLGTDGRAVTTAGATRYGTNWVGRSDLIRLRAGRGPTADTEIALNAGLATAAGVRPGDTVTVLTPRTRRSFTLVGVVEYRGHRAADGDSSEVFFTTPVAQTLMLGRVDTFSSLDVTAAAGVDPARLRDRVATTLGAGYQVVTGARLAADAARAVSSDLSFVSDLLLGFAAVSVLVGAFLIVNTFSILVAGRTRELALLATIGASRGQLRGSVLVEAFVVGLFATVLGLATGIGGGALLAASVAGADAPVDGVAVPVTAVRSAVVVGVGVTLVAALLPARRAARVPPIAALRDVAGVDRPLTRRAVVGAGLTLAGGVGLGVGTAGVVLPLLLIGALVSVVGVVLLTPTVAGSTGSLLGRVRGWSVPGRLGLLNAGRTPRRTANTAAALLVGLTVVAGLSVVAGSSKASLDRQLGHDAAADLYVSAEFGTDHPGRYTFDPAVLTRASRLPGVSEAAGQYTDDATVNGRHASVSAATDPAAFARLFGFTAVAGTLDVRRPGDAIVSPGTAQALGVRVGDTVTLRLSHGAPRTITVVGLYQTALFDGWFLSPALVGDFADQRMEFGLIDVADGTNPADVRRRVEQLLVADPNIVVSDRGAFTAQLTRQIDQALVYLRVLLSLSVLVAAFGIVNTLALSIIERTGEIGLLRVVGLHRGQVVRMIGTEAVLISTFGALLGLALGTGLGTAVARAFRHRGIPALAYPWPELATYLGLAVVLGVLAATLPALRAARTDVLTAIAHD